MPRVDKNTQLRPSILDRLIDNEPENQIEQRDNGQYQHLQELRYSVRRDLENLLNTRYRLISAPNEFTELAVSLINYGLPDLATVNIVDSEKKQKFTNDLKKILQTYEPRFESIEVQYVESQNQLDRTVHFRIEATMYADPLPEKIVFDSAMEPVTRSINIRETDYV